jgi:hypothetical protein
MGTTAIFVFIISAVHQGENHLKSNEKSESDDGGIESPGRIVRRVCILEIEICKEGCDISDKHTSHGENIVDE